MRDERRNKKYKKTRRRTGRTREINRMVKKATI